MAGWERYAPSVGMIGRMNIHLESLGGDENILGLLVLKWRRKPDWQDQQSVITKEFGPQGDILMQH